MKARLLFAVMALLMLTSLVSGEDIGIDPVEPILWVPVLTVHDIPGGACLPMRDEPDGGSNALACIEEGNQIVLYGEIALDSNLKVWRSVNFTGVQGWLPMTRNGNPVTFHG